MQNELIFELAKEAGFKRITECCPGVPNKLCSNDVWKGDLSSLIHHVVEDTRRWVKKEFNRGDSVVTELPVIAINLSSDEYKALLEHSYVENNRHTCNPVDSRLEYLAENIFDFTTYESGKDELFARKAIEVCKAISEGTTFDYIENDENRNWFLIMCNMPFFSRKIDWGTSIRGAWWSVPYNGRIALNSCGLYVEDMQLGTLYFTTRDEWEKFITAVVEFAAPEMNAEVASS
jgi:hypothetical protein